MAFFPFPTQFAQIDGLKIRYCVAGEGEPLVMIHGLAAMLEYWYANIIELSKHYRVVVFDLPGFGQSETPTNNNYTMDFYADFINHLLDFLGIQTTYLLGHSLGGALALRYAMLSTERINKLILLNNVGFSHQLNWQFRLLTLPWMARLVMRGFTPENYAKAIRSHVFYPANLSEQFITATYPMASNPRNLQSFLRILRENAWIGGIKEAAIHEIRNNLNLVQSIPTQIYWGQNDPILPYKPNAKAAQQWMPWAPFISLENCGHLSQVENSLLINKAIIDFFR